MEKTKNPDSEYIGFGFALAVVLAVPSFLRGIASGNIIYAYCAIALFLIFCDHIFKKKFDLDLHYAWNMLTSTILLLPLNVFIFIIVHMLNELQKVIESESLKKKIDSFTLFYESIYSSNRFYIVRELIGFTVWCLSSYLFGFQLGYHWNYIAEFSAYYIAVFIV